MYESLERTSESPTNLRASLRAGKSCCVYMSLPASIKRINCHLDGWSHTESSTKRLVAIHFEIFTELDLKIASGVAVSAATEILEAILLQSFGRKINSSLQNL